MAHVKLLWTTNNITYGIFLITKIIVNKSLSNIKLIDQQTAHFLIRFVLLIASFNKMSNFLLSNH